MLINGIDLKSLGVELYDRVVCSNNIDTSEEWLDGDIQPTFIRQQDRFKTIKLDFLVLCVDEDEAFKRISALTATLKKATLQFDDLDYTFDTSIISVGEPERLKNGNFIVSYVLNSSYARGQREIYTTDANMTNSFKLTVVYYKNSTSLLSTETITIRASAFNNATSTFEDLGIDVNKHQPEYFNKGLITNFENIDLTYENLLNLGVLIINYAPISYNLTVEYYMDNGEGLYNSLVSRTIHFTHDSLENFTTIGQLVELAEYRPDGYKGRVAFDKELTVENLLASSPISVFYDKLQIDRTKNILVAYQVEKDNEKFEAIKSILINVAESQFYDGMTLKDIISVSSYCPDPAKYSSGYIEGHTPEELITFDSVETSYVVKYAKVINTIYLEYYAGVYPNWSRLASIPLSFKYQDSFENSFDVIKDLNIDINKYHTNEYNEGQLYNKETYVDFNSVINSGVLQIFYVPIEYPITVNYYTDGLTQKPISETITINATMFFNAPILADIIPIQKHRPDGYQFSENLSYSGEISLSALTQASPIMIVYEEIVAVKTKNILIKYKKELASAFSTITTNLITISEADCAGGIRLQEIINLNAYKPEYYDNGIIDGYSSTTVVQYDQIQSSYEVMYLAKSYNTPIRYYVDQVDDKHWIGSSTLTYRIIDFTVNSTLYDFGLDINAFKPAYTGEGELQYTGPVNFTALLDLASVDILYKTAEEPPKPDEIDYPHRFLFLQHNDLGPYEDLHPEWTLNHAFINTGISVEDMSKLTVVMECERVDEHVPLHQVNYRYGYLFGSESALGSYFMRFNNQTTYGESLTGVNTYEAKAGDTSDMLVQAEENAIGFSENSGIYSSPQAGYSRATFTYSNLLATDGAQMPYPLFLFANNSHGSYANGLAGIGIYSCRIYYDNQLIRDFIPVSYYDKIGKLVSPSNCLYDKITGSFFEDGSGLNSFNIRDDDRYTDDNPEHQIGHCYVNYYKGEDFLKTIAIWFRGSDFVEDGAFDIYEKFFVDKNQPQYTLPGKIENDDKIIVSFNGLNNQTFKVNYEPIKAHITVNYVKDDNGIKTPIKTEEIPLMEKDFYQVPTFGDLVRLNKYKPEGYETDFVYPDKKVSLSRVINHSPYEIVYKPMTEPPVAYTTIIEYKKKVFGVRNYETIGTKVLTFDQSNFRDGEYIDFYIDKNLYKPEKYYGNGLTYQWFEMDERITNPKDLKEKYTIVYLPIKQFIDVNYYVNEVQEGNNVASTSWGIAVDELDPKFTYSLMDIFPNELINKYKPIGCDGGKIQDITTQHNFESLMALPEIAIIYKRLEEPHDPEQSYFERKVLGFGQFSNVIPTNENYSSFLNNGGKIPYIDLGYRPKELGRLKMEIKCVAQANGFMASVAHGGFQDTTYAGILGYGIPRSEKELGRPYIPNDDPLVEEDLGNMYSSIVSPENRGHFIFTPHIAYAGGLVYTAEGPQYLDGQAWYAGGSPSGVIFNIPQENYMGIKSAFRNGASSILDENYETVECFKEYWFKQDIQFKDGSSPIVPWVANLKRDPSGYLPLANPQTSIIDAYHHYATTYSNEDSNQANYEIFENTDNEIFEAKLQPKGSISLFRTTNPLTGKINIMPVNIITALQTTNTGSMALNGKINPYTGSGAVIEQDIWVESGKDEDGNPIYKKQTITKNVSYADFPVPVYPQLEAVAVWGVKIWDRDRLVRDLIPVEKGDLVYNYEMPENGLFDLVTEIFFGNSNEGGEYEVSGAFGLSGGTLQMTTQKVKVNPEDVAKLWVIQDPGFYGQIVSNYYDYDYTFINNQFINVPTWYSKHNTTLEEILGYNDYKPDDFHLDGLLDLGDNADRPVNSLTLQDIYELGTANIFYKLKSFTKTIVYYQNNKRVGSKDIFYSIKDIQEANTLNDLGIDLDLYWTEDFKHGRIVFDENILKENNIQAFIDAPSPIVIYDKLTREEAPNVFYVEYYRGGASDDTLITPDPLNPNYLDCDLDGVVLNPNGAIKYFNHYHSALYEDEKFDYFIPYQVKVINKYVGIHRGPARRFPNLAFIVDRDTYTIIEERNGWGRLKEYPVGWIMLSATEPMTGPGQNPNYDVPDADTATVPFKTNIHINKLTIDRLWCYVPEVESWIKTEDISYNQSGKYLNALDINIIHLDTVDWTVATSLSKVGIYPNKYELYFHDKIKYDYTGAYTKDAFSNLHSLEFVYPETVYNYSCIYYKDNVFDGGDKDVWGKSGVGHVKETENTFVSKWQHFDILEGPYLNQSNQMVYKIKYEPTEYGAPPTRIAYIEADKIVVEVAPEKIETKHLPSNEIGRASFSCSISDWNPDWDIFLETSWKIDDQGNSINPTLYRGTPLVLDWSYFGFDKNLYRPEGYPEGIYMWNARSWNRDKVEFSFEELIRCGTQYVFYPCFDPDTYKIWIYPQWLGGKNNFRSKNYLNPGIGVDFRDPKHLSARDNFDISVEGEVAPQNNKLLWDEYQHQYANQNLKIHEIGANKLSKSALEIYSASFNNRYTFPYPPSTRVISNVSGLRSGVSRVIGFGNEYTNQPPQYYYKTREYDGDWQEITDTTPISQVGHYDYNPKINYGKPEYYKLDVCKFVGDYCQFDYNNYLLGIINNCIVYRNFLMVRYWVPVPKGLWYRFNGEEKRIPDNGLFDLLTGDFVRSYKKIDGELICGWYYSSTSNPQPLYPDDDYYPNHDAIDYMFLRTKHPDINKPYNYFDGWEFISTDIDYIVQIDPAEVNTYKYPDIYATQISTLAPGLVLPVSKTTEDDQHKVVGKWYFSGNEWFDASSAKLHSGTFDKSKLSKLQTNICLVKPKVETTYYVYLDPSAVATVGENSNATYPKEIIHTVYYSYVDNNNNKFYFDGTYWVPEAYTSLNVKELNKNYAVVPEYIPYYSVPIEDPEYQVGQYHYGDRLTISNVCAQDEEWGFTGLGWVRVNSTNLSEVI